MSCGGSIISIIKSLLGGVNARVDSGICIVEGSLSKSGVRRPILSGICIILLRGILSELIGVKRVAKLRLSQICIAVNVRLRVGELLGSHSGVLLVGSDCVTPFTLRQPLQRVEVIQIILSSNVGGVARYVIYRRIRVCW